MTYAQRGEDDLIIGLVDAYGRYLDIGAFDGKTFSNTRLLAEKGWEGVCVEPAAHAFAAMVNDPPPNAILVNGLIARHRGPTPFHYSKDALSTTVDKHAHKWASIAAYVSTCAVAMTVGDLLSAFPGPYDLISVDCEGTTDQIVDDLRDHLDELETKVIIYEHDGSTANIRGFREILRTEENSVMVRR